MKRLLLATTVLTLGLGGAAFAQTGAGSAGAGSTGSTMDSPPHSAPSTSGSSMNDQNMNGSSANAGPMASSGMSDTSSGGQASSDQIKQAQEALQTKGLYHGEIDGKWGPETSQAITQFQKQKGLKQTAQLDQQTMGDLQNGSMGGSDNMSSSPSSSSSMQGKGSATQNSNMSGQNSGMPAH